MVEATAELERLMGKAAPPPPPARADASRLLADLLRDGEDTLDDADEATLPPKKR
jgi:hypothetical protein